MLVKKLLATATAVLFLLSGCAHSDADPEPTSTQQGVIVVPSQTPTPEPSPSQANTIGSDGEDVSLPDGVSESEFVENRQDAFNGAISFWNAYNNVSDGKRENWLENVGRYSTAAQQQRNADEAESFEFAQDGQWLAESQANCETVSWKDQGWVSDQDDITSTHMTVVIPTRVQCLDNTMSESIQHHTKITWQENTGITGEGVEVTPFEMELVDGKWLVNEFNHMDVGMKE